MDIPSFNAKQGKVFVNGRYQEINEENQSFNNKSAVMGIRTPVASVRGSHDWPVYTITAVAQ